MTKTLRGAIWAGIWCFKVTVSRNHHPTLLIDGVATGLLLAAFASAIYTNWLVLVPRYWNTRRFGAYWVSLVGTMVVLTIGGVLVIQAACDRLWGPDPRRFGFWVNVGLDFTGMTVHLLGAGAIVWLFAHNRRTVGEGS